MGIHYTLAVPREKSIQDNLYACPLLLFFSFYLCKYILPLTLPVGLTLARTPNYPENNPRKGNSHSAACPTSGSASHTHLRSVKLFLAQGAVAPLRLP